MKTRLAQILLALTLILPSTFIAAAPASANHDVNVWYCYTVDNYAGETREDYGNGWYWVTKYYDHYDECTDGHGFYEWWWRYRWGQGGWVQTV